MNKMTACLLFLEIFFKRSPKPIHKKLMSARKSKTYKYIQLTQAQQDMLLKHVWGEIEKPLWITRCDYTCQYYNKNSSGAVMMTRGAIYVFRSRMMKGYRLRYHIGLLNIKNIDQAGNTIIMTIPFESKSRKHDEIVDGSDDEVSNEEIELLQDRNEEQEINETKLRLDIPHAIDFMKLLVSIININKFNLSKTNIGPKITCELDKLPEIPTVRPKQLLKRRAILFAHCECEQGINLEIANYFQQKWDGGDTLYLGSSFHPSIFAAPFGHAVGLDNSIKNVAFRSATFSKFPAFLDALVSNAITTELISFLNYSRNKSLSFSFSSINQTHVSKWWFINTSKTVLLPFLQASVRLPKPLKELVIAKHSYNINDMKEIFQAIKESSVILKCRTIKFIHLRFNAFPFDDLTRVSLRFENVETFYFHHVNVDGNLLLAALCRGRPCIKQLSIVETDFETNLNPGFKMPKGIVALDISQSRFVGSAFSSFLGGITRIKSNYPFIFNARRLKLTEVEYKKLNDLDLSQCQPNLLELDYSHNDLVDSGFKPFFNFLATQTRLKQLVLNDVVTNDSYNFMTNLVNVIQNNKLDGIELGVHFDSIVYSLFLSSLFTCTTLTRFCLKNSCLGNEGLYQMISVLKTLPCLREFAGDGFFPTPLTEEELREKNWRRHPLLDVWKIVGLSEKMTHNDFPYNDFETAKIDTSTFARKDQIWLERIKERPIPTTQKERIETLLSSLRDEDSSDDASDTTTAAPENEAE